MEKMKIAIVHDWLPFMGGAENVLINMHRVFPNAPIYTTLCNRERISGELAEADIHTTYLQKNGRNVKNHRNKFPFMPTAMENFDLRGYDIVLSSSSSVAKCVITGPDTLHICYCHTPMRYGWEFMHDYIEDLNGAPGLNDRLKSYLMSVMRVWDCVSAQRVDYFVANSVNVARRIKKYYRREAFVIHPPVRSSRFSIEENLQDYYLCVSRLQEYKRVDLAVKACSQLGAPLVVIGDGPERKRLEREAGPTVRFLGRISDGEIREYYSKCKAFLFPGEEDFGITPLEAQASGRPVIAYGKGGALETVIDKETGIFFYEQTPESMIRAIKEAEQIKFLPEKLRENAVKFDDSVFRERLKKFVYEKNEEYRKDKLKGIVIYK